MLKISLFLQIYITSIKYSYQLYTVVQNSIWVNKNMVYFLYLEEKGMKTRRSSLKWQKRAMFRYVRPTYYILSNEKSLWKHSFITACNADYLVTQLFFFSVWPGVHFTYSQELSLIYDRRKRNTLAKYFILRSDQMPIMNWRKQCAIYTYFLRQHKQQKLHQVHFKPFFSESGKWKWMLTYRIREHESKSGFLSF